MTIQEIVSKVTSFMAVHEISIYEIVAFITIAIGMVKYIASFLKEYPTDRTIAACLIGAGCFLLLAT